jgi:hypothetical protein
VKPDLHLFTSVLGKRVEVFCGGKRQDNRFHSDNIAQSSVSQEIISLGGANRPFTPPTS